MVRLYLGTMGKIVNSALGKLIRILFSFSLRAVLLMSPFIKDLLSHWVRPVFLVSFSPLLVNTKCFSVECLIGDRGRERGGGEGKGEKEREREEGGRGGENGSFRAKLTPPLSQSLPL